MNKSKYNDVCMHNLSNPQIVDHLPFLVQNLCKTQNTKIAERQKKNRAVCHMGKPPFTHPCQKLHTSHSKCLFILSILIFVDLARLFSSHFQASLGLIVWARWWQPPPPPLFEAMWSDFVVKCIHLVNFWDGGAFRYSPLSEPIYLSQLNDKLVSCDVGILCS